MDDYAENFIAMPRSGTHYFPHIPLGKILSCNYNTTAQEDEICRFTVFPQIENKQDLCVQMEEYFRKIQSIYPSVLIRNLGPSTLKLLNKILRVKAKAVSTRVKYEKETLELFQKRSYVSHI